MISMAKKKKQTEDDWDKIKPDPIMGGPESYRAKIIFVQLRKYDTKRDDAEIIKDIQVIIYT